ncbi:MAG: hypothetical protein ACRD5B_02200 [Nitrososphaeraceae archaeon]
MTIDLYSKVQQEFATGGTPIALTIPVTINSSLVHEGDEIRVCLTMTTNHEREQYTFAWHVTEP